MDKAKEELKDEIEKIFDNEEKCVDPFVIDKLSDTYRQKCLNGVDQSSLQEVQGIFFECSFSNETFFESLLLRMGYFSKSLFIKSGKILPDFHISYLVSSVFL